MFRTLTGRFSAAEDFFHVEEDTTSSPQTGLQSGASQPTASGNWLSVGQKLLMAIGGVFACCLPVAWMLASRSRGEFQWWLSEEGPIEMASGWGYLTTGSGLIALSLLTSLGMLKSLGMPVQHHRRSGKCSAETTQSLRQGAGASSAMLGLCLVLLACREFDWHKRWTSGGIMKLSYYFDSSVAIPERLLVIAVLGLIGWLLIATISRHSRGFIAALLAGKSVALLVAVGLLLLPISKVLDSSRRVFSSLGAELPQATQMLVVATEELVELAIPVCFLAACLLALTPLRRLRQLFG